MKNPALFMIGLAAAAGTLATVWSHGTYARVPSDTEVTSEDWPALGIEVQEMVLENGFRVVLLEDHRVPRVAASLWYRTGALQEHAGEHGETHFLEHVIHQGTNTIGVKDPALDRTLLKEIYETEQQLLAARNAIRNQVRERRIFFDEEDVPTNEKIDSLQQRIYELEDEQSENRTFWVEYNWYRENGALTRHTDPIPANTGNELLRIEVDLPKTRVEMFFRLEADRMVNAVLRGFDAQRFTVLEQFLMINRRSMGRFNEALNGASGIVHPIYLHPGGHMRDHWYWNRESVLRVYDDYFVPNNATLVLVGALSADEVLPLAEKYFGQLPRGPEPPAEMDYEAEPPPGGAVRLDWLEPLSPSLTVRYRIPGVGHPDRPVFDVIAGLLGGPDGLLAAEQERSGVPTVGWGAGAGRTGSPSRLSLQASPQSDEDLPGLERVALAAVERLRNGEIDERKLAHVRRENHFDWARLRSDRGGLAQMIGEFGVMDDWRTIRSYYEGRETVTAAEVRRVAERYLVPWNRVIGTTRRNPTPAAEGNTGDTQPRREP